MPDTAFYRISSWCLAALALIFVLKFGLLGALLTGLLVHEVVRASAPASRRSSATERRGKLIALGWRSAWW